MSASCPPQTSKTKRSAFSWLGILLLSLFGLCAAVLVVVMVRFYLFPSLVARDLRPSQARQVISDLRMAILSYQVEYNHLPITEPFSHNDDVANRSRGPLLPALLGREASPLNPRGIKFFEGPFDSDSKHGLWRDGSEWVLRDRWGEPYFIIFDTNGDNKIANPAFTTDQSGSKDAEKSTSSPPPQKLSETVLIYSSGLDRDPKTWQDNVCSWRDFPFPN